MNLKFSLASLVVIMAVLLLVSPVAVFGRSSTTGMPLSPGGGVASGCPSLNGAQQQPVASFLTYSDTSGTIKVQTTAETGNSLIAICVYPSGGIKTTTYTQTVDSSISAKWGTAQVNDHLDWGRLTGTDTLAIDGSTYTLGTVSPNPTIVMVVAHVMGTLCPGDKASNTCFFQVSPSTVVTPEFPLGAILAILAPLAAVGLYFGSRKGLRLHF